MMNEKFAQNIINIYGDKGRQWLIDLPKIVAEIAKEWRLADIREIGNLSINYVVSCVQDFSQVILKLSLDEDLINREYTALKALANYGAVDILNHKSKTLLLKKLSPGVSLKSYLPDRKEEALKIACEVAKKLHQAPLNHNIKLPTIEERFATLDKDWPIEQNYLALARKFRDEIFSKYQIRKVLHGDLHLDNILSDGDSWKVIDPHGVIGFPINEVWSFAQDANEDLPLIANYFEFDLDHVRKCYFMHTLLSAVWALEDNMDPKPWLKRLNNI